MLPIPSCAKATAEQGSAAPMPLSATLLPLGIPLFTDGRRPYGTHQSVARISGRLQNRELHSRASPCLKPAPGSVGT